MKRAKNYEDAKTIYYKPEIDKCLNCSKPLKRSHRIWNKYIHKLTGTIYAVSVGYRCSDAECQSMVYRCAFAESLSLKYYSFGLDVICEIGRLRFTENRTIGEIHHQLSESIAISEREIQYLIETYMLLIAGIKRDKSYLNSVLSDCGIVVSIDGIQPEKGNEVLYIVRDVISGEVLSAENLLCSDSKSIKSLIEPVIELEYPILGVISDGQQSIRLAINELLPDVPYQLCHYHYLNGISKPLMETDRKLKTKLKKDIRDVRRIERQAENLDDETEKQVLLDFTLALRTIALTSSVYPFSCGGLLVYQQLDHLQETLLACQKKKPHPILTRLLTIVSRHQSHADEYRIVAQLFDIITRIATLIDPQHFCQDSKLKRGQRLLGYIGYLTKLREKACQMAQYLDTIIKITKSFLIGLFAYLDCDKLPTTNNELEIFHRQVKTKHRRRTGRRSSHDYLIRYGRFVVYQIGSDCVDQISHLSYSRFSILKAQLKSINTRYQQIFQLRHHLLDFLSTRLDLWNPSLTPQIVET